MNSSFVCRSLAAVVAVLAMLSFAGTQQLVAQSESPVQMSGTIKDSTGKPVAACPIKLFKVNFNPGAEIGGGGRGGSGGKRDAFGTPDTIEMQNKIGQMVAQAVTDANGQYVFKSVKPGNYRYQAGNAKTTGYAGDSCTVAAGQNMTLDITLQPPQH